MEIDGTRHVGKLRRDLRALEAVQASAAHEAADEAMTPERLDELETYRPDDDTPDDAKIRIPAGDLRDLVRLIPVVRAAFVLRDGHDGGEAFKRELARLEK